MLPSERLRLNASKSESLPVRGDAAGVPPEGGPRQRLAASRYRGGPGRSRRLRRRSPKPAAGSSARNPIRRVERDARSLADDLGMDRGVVPSRAAASLRSAETKPFDPRDLPAPQTGESLGVRAAGRPPPSDGIPPTPSPGSGPRAGARPERRGRLLAPGRSEAGRRRRRRRRRRHPCWSGCPRHGRAPGLGAAGAGNGGGGGEPQTQARRGPKVWPGPRLQEGSRGRARRSAAWGGRAAGAQVGAGRREERSKQTTNRPKKKTQKERSERERESL